MKMLLRRINCFSPIFKKYRQMFYDNINKRKTNEFLIINIICLLFSLTIIFVNLYSQNECKMNFTDFFNQTKCDYGIKNSLSNNLLTIESIFLGLFSTASFTFLGINQKQFSQKGIKILNEVVDLINFFLLLSVTVILILLILDISNNLIRTIFLFCLYFALMHQLFDILIFLKRIHVLSNDKE
jgi:hypothetical protein